jgi:RimJ/RimL family protein N-acetyltransferase
VKTERLILRRPVEADADAPIWVGIAPEEALTRIEDHWQRHGFGSWTAVLKETGEPVAVIDLHFAGPGITGVDEDEIEVGWVVAYTSPGNAASMRVMEKLGMTVRGEGRSRDGKVAVILVARRAPRRSASC